MTDECAPVPLTMATATSPAQAADAQFIVIPVAVVGHDLDAEGSDTIVDIDGDKTYPRLVSTIQLIHVESGRLMGTSACLSEGEGCNRHAPVLLPK